MGPQKFVIFFPSKKKSEKPTKPGGTKIYLQKSCESYAHLKKGARLVFGEPFQGIFVKFQFVVWGGVNFNGLIMEKNEKYFCQVVITMVEIFKKNSPDKNKGPIVCNDADTQVIPK